jgi:anti-sigma factor RsiW
MNTNTHERAHKLVAQRRIEGVSADEQSWLEAHLAECEACATLDVQTGAALSALRLTQIELPRNLASRTQMRVRLRADELNEREPGRRLLWALVGISWMLGVATAPLVWRGFEWVGGEFGLPKIVLLSGMALWWLVPGLLVTGAVVMQKQKAERGAE